MKLKSLAQILTAFGLAIGAVFAISKPSYAEQPTRFFCGTYNNAPATMAQTQRGNIPIFIWRSEYFTESGYTPHRRCMVISRRFQIYYNRGTLNYLTTGIMNGQPVVCVAETRGGSCTGLIITLRDGSNPNHLLASILNIFEGARAPIYENDESADYQSDESADSRIYIDMNEYLNRTF